MQGLFNVLNLAKEKILKRPEPSKLFSTEKSSKDSIISDHERCTKAELQGLTIDSRDTTFDMTQNLLRNGTKNMPSNPCKL